MITLIWRTDVHLADRPPQSRTDDWSETILRKIVQVGDLARKEKAVGVLDGGDFFHIKSPSRNSHQLVSRAAQVHQGYPCPVWATIGNHDCKYGSSEFLEEGPLGVLFETGVFKRLYDSHEALFEEPLEGRGPVPSSFKVRVVGIPYHGTSYDMNRFTTITKGDEDFLVVVAHCLASERGGTLFEGEDVVKYGDLANLDPDVWCYLPGTKILDHNYRSFPIESVRKGALVRDRAGNATVEEVHPVRFVDEEVVVLDVEGIPSDLIPGVTKEHPFWVCKGLGCALPSRSDKPSESRTCSKCETVPPVAADWVSAGKIESGDYMAVPLPDNHGTNHNPGLARLLGLYLAEGHVINNRKREPVAGVGWSFHEDEVRLRQSVEDLVREHFGLQVHVHPGQNHCVHICAYGAEISRFFLDNGGKLAPHKTVSSWVWELDSASRIELLLGWLEGNGHARKPQRDRPRAEVLGATVSPDLATQMFLLACSVGLRPYYTIRPGDVHATRRLPVHCISFYGADADYLSSRMGKPAPKRCKTKVAGFFNGGFYWVRVKSVARVHYKGPVYNMRTSSQEYVAGLLLTHNCFGHWHKDQGVKEIAPGKWVVNTGSLSRGSLSQDDLKRQPKCVSLHFTVSGFTFKIHPIDVKPVAEVFDIEGRNRRVARSEAMETFVGHLKESLTYRAEGIPITDAIRALTDVPDDVKERAISYVEQASRSR